MLGEFLETQVGMVTTIVVTCVVLVILMGDLYKKKNLSVRTLAYSAMCIALASVLSMMKISMPFGGSITPCSVLMIVLVGYWFGPLTGFLAGITHGLIQLTLDPYVLHPIQMLLDYQLAFGALGLAGFFRNMKWGLAIGYIVAVFGRFLMSTISGYVFFGMYAPEGMPILWYSITYNLSYTGIEAILTLTLISIPAFRNVLERIKILLKNPVTNVF